jgi:Ca2+-binding RTX toxin-like protein
VESSVNYTLPANVENLALNDSAWNGTGNGLANWIIGNGESNILNGRGGADVMYGGGGVDYFVFDTALGRGNADTLGDFNPVDDEIQLDNAVFSALTMSPGVDLRNLTADEFRVGTRALDTGDRIIYNWSTGELLYDPDGIGAAAAIQFASIGAGLNVTQADFQII